MHADNVAKQSSENIPSPAVESGLAMPLSGAWRFRLDAKAEGLAAEWFNQKLPDLIELPGSCEQRGFGLAPEKPEELRLTRVLEYVGPAWYQREIEIPAGWSGKRVELFLERYKRKTGSQPPGSCSRNR